jgi:hypothetical protein
VNAKLLRAVLAHVEDHPELLDLTTHGEARTSGGIAADVAGRALLESGWTLVAKDAFRSPDGLLTVSHWMEIEREARLALGLTETELWGGGDFECLFTVTGRDAVTARLRELTGEAEAANG